ncbi:VWA domain-containing protein [Arsukibacterium sp.]|uniref:vWA domain-containing protein n=1 Tax=Arsukibacterium sp. TaxID=1977258 RepID=UPI00299F4659|nr:VWA domain-containing protein [Arsukibacterium sp.]MDX1676976.1 VWA domain-containing protein [Arsukibacterium sp.]
MFEFSYPWLLLLIVVPLFFKKRQQDIGSALTLPALARLAGNQQRPAWKSRFATLPKAVIWLMLVLAACQPRWLGEPVTLPQQGRDLMLAIDLSGSMDMNDMVLEGQSMNRLAAVKWVVGDFIQQRKGDRLGLILFADAAYQQTPLTYDLATVQSFLDDSQLKLVGQRTAIGEAIGLAVKRLNQYETSNKVLILLSDGANNAGNIQPLEALELAKAAGIKIYTVGVGADQMVQQTIFGQRTVNPSQDLDEQLLNHIASETGGRYFRARNPAELAQIYRLLDQLEPISRDNLTYRPQYSLLHWPLAIALLLSFVLAIRQINWRRLYEPAG